MIFETILILSVLLFIIALIFIVIVKNNAISEKINMFKLKALLMMKRNEEAKKLALKMAERFPHNYDVHKILGELYEKVL